MKTALFTPCYLNGVDKSGSQRFDRNVRYLKWYREHKSALGIDDIWLLDNGSNPARLTPFREMFPTVEIVSLPFVAKGPGHLDYGYFWRAMWWMASLTHVYDRIVHIDSDCFVVSSRLATYIKNSTTGWEAFWVPKYSFPSSECFVLNRDAYPLFREYASGDWQRKVGVQIEGDMPFTKINKDFVTDRFGEDRTPQAPDMDGYFQAPTDIPLVFR